MTDLPSRRTTLGDVLSAAFILALFGVFSGLLVLAVG